MPSNKGNLFKDKEPPYNKALRSSYLSKRVLAANKQSSSKGKSNIKISTTCKGKDKALLTT